MGTELRIAASRGETDRMVRLLDGVFAGSESSLRMRRLAQDVRACLEAQLRRHRADPVNEPEHIPLEDFPRKYGDHTGNVLDWVTLGYPLLRDMLDPRAAASARFRRPRCPPPAGGNGC